MNILKVFIERRRSRRVRLLSIQTKAIFVASEIYSVYARRQITWHDRVRIKIFPQHIKGRIWGVCVEIREPDRSLVTVTLYLEHDQVYNCWRVTGEGQVFYLPHTGRSKEHVVRHHHGGMYSIELNEDGLTAYRIGTNERDVSIVGSLDQFPAPLSKVA